MSLACKVAWRSRHQPGIFTRNFQSEILAHRQHSGRSERTKLLRQFADYASKKTLGCFHVVGSFFLQIPPLEKDAPWRPAHTINITQSECSRSAGSSSIRPSPWSVAAATEAQCEIQTDSEVLPANEPRCHHPEYPPAPTSQGGCELSHQNAHEQQRRPAFGGEMFFFLGDRSGSIRSSLEVFSRISAPASNSLWIRRSSKFSMRMGELFRWTSSTPERSSAWTCRRNLRAERLYIDTLSYYFSFSVASNKPPPEKKANLIVLFGDQARDPHKGETRLGLGDWEA
jgi:hypothetical protein